CRSARAHGSCSRACAPIRPTSRPPQRAVICPATRGLVPAPRMSTGNAFLVLSAFLASAVEMVEALTIVLAAGVARGWRSALTGLRGAAGALAGGVCALGPAITTIPLNALRLVVGGLLLTFGLQWLRKAILR